MIMTQDEIIRMALEAGLSMVLDDEGEKVVERFAALVSAHEREKLKNVAIFSRWYDELDKAVLAEREACAKVCEEVDINNKGFPLNAKTYAAAIRARGEK